MCAGRACGADAVVGSREAVAEADVPGGEVQEEARDVQGGDAFVVVYVRAAASSGGRRGGVGDGGGVLDVEVADARTEGYAGSFEEGGGGGVPVCCGEGLFGGGEGVLRVEGGFVGFLSYGLLGCWVGF
jgi:hypothetical protein